LHLLVGRFPVPASNNNRGKEREMEKHQARVVAEKEELDGKIERLRAFIAGDTFGGLSEAERRRLRRQESIMGLYSDVLDERIIAFS
jgi:hypothetical protein